MTKVGNDAVRFHIDASRLPEHAREGKPLRSKGRQSDKVAVRDTGLKVPDHLDTHCRKFIVLSPFYDISSARVDGRAETSPRGDPPGSPAHVLDDKPVLLPDRPGNRQVDTSMHLVERPYAGLVFFVPGLTETLRVNGRAEMSTDVELLAPLAIKGKLPVCVLKVTVEEASLRCAKAFDSSPTLGAGRAS